MNGFSDLVALSHWRLPCPSNHPQKMPYPQDHIGEDESLIGKEPCPIDPIFGPSGAACLIGCA